MDMIPVSEPLFDIEEENNLVDCIRNGWVSSEGSYVREFEQLCADYLGVKEAVAVSSGTSALKLAVKALHLEKGSEVILPTFTIISCVIAVLEADLVPVLVDADPDTWCMDVDQIENKITSKTKAIMVVHIYGHSTDMDPILELAKKNNLLIIEDLAEAHGTEYKGQKCGSFSDVSILSFYANKLVTTGEGGMVLSKSTEIANRVRYYRNLCFKAEQRFYHTDIGHNYRLSNIQAAVGVAQVKKLDQFISRKVLMASKYNEGLKNLPLQLPVQKEWCKNIYWMYALVIQENAGFSREKVVEELRKKSIQTRPFFIGMHEQPVFKNMGLFKNETYPVSEYIAKEGFYLPSGQAITDKQIAYIVDVLQEIFSK